MIGFLIVWVVREGMMEYNLVRREPLSLYESRRANSLELAARIAPKMDFTSGAVEAIREGYSSFEMYESARARVGNQTASITHTFKFRGRK